MKIKTIAIIISFMTLIGLLSSCDKDENVVKNTQSTKKVVETPKEVPVDINAEVDMSNVIESIPMNGTGSSDNKNNSNISGTGSVQ